MAEHKTDYTPRYHARVAKGWSNDPNGMIWYDGKAHLFFQHYPHKAEWGTMHWGHFTTTDFIHWKEEDLALAPDEDYEAVCGCCSGNAIEKDGKLILMYTAAQPELQRQCLAISDDGVHFKKDENNPILTADMLSEEVCMRDFRDPKLFFRDGYYYCICGTRIIDPEDVQYVEVESGEIVRNLPPEARMIYGDHGLVHAGGGRMTFEDHTAVHGGGPIEDHTAVHGGKPIEDHTAVHGGAHAAEHGDARINAHHMVHGHTLVHRRTAGGKYIKDPLPTSAAVLGGEYEATGYGNMILIRSRDLYSWEYCGKLLERQEGFHDAFYELDGVYECPDYFELDGHEIILSSPQNLMQLDNEYQNIHSVLYFEGKLDFQTGHFEVNEICEIDGGFDIYAPQSMLLPDGRRVMIAWKEMWDRTYPTRDLGWAGTYTLPRELSYHDGHLYQTPIREIFDCRRGHATCGEMELKNESSPVEGFSGSCMELDVNIDPGSKGRIGIKVFAGQYHETNIYYDAREGAVVIDRTHSGERVEGREENLNVRTCSIDECRVLKLQIFLDHSSVEVFINDGRYVMSGNVYPDETDTGVEFFAAYGKGRIISAEKWDIEP